MDTTTEAGLFSAEPPVDEAQVLLADPHLLPHLWPHVEHFFEEAPVWWTARYDPQDVFDAVSRGEMQLWVTNDADSFLSVTLTALRHYPKLTTGAVLLTVGRDMRRWLHHLQLVELWLRQQGAEYIQISGRRSWPRVLARYGYQYESTSLAKSLVNMTLN